MTETLNELIAEWRTKADSPFVGKLSRGQDEAEAGYAAHCEALRSCADELSSALAGIARSSPSEKIGEALGLSENIEVVPRTARPSGAEQTELGAGSRPLTRIDEKGQNNEP